MLAYYRARTHIYSSIYTFIHVPFFFIVIVIVFLYSEFEPYPALCLVHKVNNRKDWTRKRKEQVKYCSTHICRLFKCEQKIDQINVQSLKVRTFSCICSFSFKYIFIHLSRINSCKTYFFQTIVWCSKAMTVDSFFFFNHLKKICFFKSDNTIWRLTNTRASRGCVSTWNSLEVD